jgi:NTE family protein
VLREIKRISQPFTSRVFLTDGGIYDNLGLETVWKRYDTVLVSDGGGKTEEEAEPKSDWARHAYRILNLIDHQVRSLRKRQVIAAYKVSPSKGWLLTADCGSVEMGDNGADGS